MSTDLDISVAFRAFAAKGESKNIILLDSRKKLVGSIYLDQLDDPYDISIMINDQSGERYYLVYKKTFGIFFSYYQFG